MAIYHLSSTIISRSQGRSAVACAAYRSGTQINDEHYGKTHDYTKKEEIAHTEIFLPENAPHEFKDRAILWNTVEKNEKRKDAQLAREFTISLPRELSIEQNKELIVNFVKNEFVSLGMIADLAIHNDAAKDGEKQPHAHVMLTLREVSQEGFGLKKREWNDKNMLLYWREKWSEYANQQLFKHGHDIKIDHRTLEEQGIDLEPQHKIGSSAAQERLARLEDHKRIAKENGERLLGNPNIALNAITHQQSTFTEQDIAKFVNRHTLDAEQFQSVFSKVKASNELVYLGKDSKNVARYTTKDMLTIEIKMLERTQALATSPSHSVSEENLNSAIQTKSLTEQQKIAFEHITNQGDLKCIVGFAGTGKSYLLGSAKEAWEAEGYQVLGATLSGIAAENLEASSSINSRTLASRFYYWNRGEQLLSKNSILVIDEAGMIGSKQMTKVLDLVVSSGAKAILVGDPEQLQAIEAGAAFRAIADHTGYVELAEIRRQAVDWQANATKEFATGKTAQALARYDEHNHIHAFQTQTLAQKALIEQWNDTRISNSLESQIILSFTRKEALDLNHMARELRQSLGELGESHALLTAKGKRDFSINDRIYFLKNNRQMGVMNGTLGTIKDIKDNHLTVQLDSKSDEKPEIISFDAKSYNHIDHGYAATIHKAQGVTVDRSYILASKYMDRHATYVAGSRHRLSADLFYSREVFPSQNALSSTLSRERLKEVSLDFDDHKFVYANARDIKGQQERLAADAEKRAEKFEKALSENPSASKINHAFQVLANKIARHEGIMNYFFERNPNLHNKIEELSKQHRTREFKIEEQALGAQDIMIRMNKALTVAPNEAKLQKARMDFAVRISNNVSMMNYFEKNTPTLAQQVLDIAKNQQKNIDKGFERDERGL